MLYNLHFFSSKCRLFHNATLFGFCITHILNTGCAKFEKIKSVTKRLNPVVNKVLTKLERVKKLNFICEPKYYTFTSEGFPENSYLLAGVPQMQGVYK
jgi:hypothetical protein